VAHFELSISGISATADTGTINEKSISIEATVFLIWNAPELDFYPALRRLAKTTL
jgi:hypothetical protein